MELTNKSYTSCFIISLYYNMSDIIIDLWAYGLTVGLDGWMDGSDQIGPLVPILCLCECVYILVMSCMYAVSFGLGATLRSIRFQSQTLRLRLAIVPCSNNPSKQKLTNTSFNYFERIYAS